MATPANWVDGEDCIISPAVKDEDIPALSPGRHLSNPLDVLLRHQKRTESLPDDHVIVRQQNGFRSAWCGRVGGECDRVR